MKLQIRNVALEVTQKFNSGHYLLEGGVQVVRRHGVWLRKVVPSNCEARTRATH